MRARESGTGRERLAGDGSSIKDGGTGRWVGDHSSDALFGRKKARAPLAGRQMQGFGGSAPVDFVHGAVTGRDDK